MSEDELRAYASGLAQRFIIVDGHVDLPYALAEKNFRRALQASTRSSIQARESSITHAPLKEGWMHHSCRSIFLSNIKRILTWAKGSPTH